MTSRSQNERKFTAWQALDHGGRVYWLEIQGRNVWKARYCKEVDASENTIRFWQEIYDAEGKLVETHQKFPVDLGHRKVEHSE